MKNQNTTIILLVGVLLAVGWTSGKLQKVFNALVAK